MPVPLVDRFGRQVRDLRLSVTDRCNFRCTYCMPEEGMTWLPRTDLLTFEELTRVARVCVERFGVGSIRITGGEPTVRAHLPDLIERLSALGAELSMTTNGTTLRAMAGALKAAGLHRVTVSLDSLSRERFTEITRRDGLGSVLDGIDAAVEAGLSPVKVNCVLVRGVNDDEVEDLAAFGRDRGVEMRFIEWMPLDGGGAWSGDRVVPASEIVGRIAARFPLEAVGERRDAAPAERWRYLDGRGHVGVVASVTRPFCATCDRIRITAEGSLRSCLFAVRDTDLRALLRDGASDDELAAAIAAEVAEKWEGHAIGQVRFIRPTKSMSQIGG
jgi:cyclic pyranopterin phosphate synthase